MAFWDDWQKNKNPITWSEGFQHGYKKIPKSSTPSSEELSLAKANKKLVGKEKLDKNMQDTVQKVVKNMIKEGNTSGRFDKNKPRDLDKFNRKFMDVSSTADSNSYTITSRIKRPFPGREYAHKTIHNDGTETISYGPTPNPKDATDFIGKRSATKPTVGSAVKGATSFVTPITLDSGEIIDSEEFFRELLGEDDATDLGNKASTTKPESKPKAEPKAKPTIDSTVKEAAKPESKAEPEPKVKPEFKPKAESKAKPEPKVNSTIDSTVKEAIKHFNKTSAEPASNSAVKNSVGNKLKNSKVGNWLKNTGNWLKNTKVGGYFTDSPLTPMNVALTHKPHMGGTPILRSIAANPVAYQLMQGMGVGGGYMPLPGGPEENRNRLRTEFGQDELSDIDTVVKMNPQGTIYLDPKLGIQPTEVVEDYEGNRFYRNVQTGQFEPLDYNPRYSTYVPLPRVKKVYPTDSNGIPYLNDILGGVLSMPKSDTPLPIPPMVPPVSADEGEIPSGKVEVPAQPVQTLQSAQPVNKPNVASVVRQRRAPKPGVVNDTPAANVTPVSTSTPPVTAPTLSSVASQAVRHNGGFDNYRRESVLSALRAAGGISPAEAVQRGIIPMEALNYI